MCDILIGRLGLGLWEILSVTESAWQFFNLLKKKMRRELLQILGQIALYVPDSHNKQFIKCMYYLMTVLFLICKASCSLSGSLLFCCKWIGFALGCKPTVFPFFDLKSTPRLLQSLLFPDKDIRLENAWRHQSALWHSCAIRLWFAKWTSLAIAICRCSSPV